VGRGGTPRRWSLDINRWPGTRLRRSEFVQALARLSSPLNGERAGVRVRRPIDRPPPEASHRSNCQTNQCVCLRGQLCKSLTNRLTLALPMNLSAVAADVRRLKFP